MNRRAIVEGIDSAGHLVLRLPFGESAEKALPRPIVGSSTTGLHTTPPQGAHVLIQYEDGLFPYPAATMTATDGLGALPAQAAGETFIVGPRGDVLSHATVSGQLVIYRNAANTLSVTVDPSTNRVNVTASGGLWVNGTQVSVP